MATTHLRQEDFNWNELLKVRFQNLAAAPGSPAAGWAYFDTVLEQWGVYDGTDWVYLGAGGTDTEAVQDIVGAMFTGNTETGISVDYQDGDGTIDLVAEVTQAELDAKIDKATLDANSVLYATSDDTPAALAMGASTILARLAAGNIVAATPAQLRTLLNVEDGATNDQTAAEILAALLTVDGAASGLDADLLDGQSSAFYATATSVSDHLADATDAHDASAISFSPASGIAATDVQTAIVEALTDAQAYADSVAQGLKAHASVKAVALSALDLNGAETIDGYSTSNGDRILVTAQADADDNGIWVVAAGAWTRPTDFDAAAEVAEGAYTLVEEGTIYEGTGWVLSELAGSFGSLTEQTWTQFSGAGEITAGNALTKTGNTLDVVAGTGLEISSDTVRIAAAAAGDGLTGGAGSALAVGAGTGVTVNANDVAVDTAVVVRKYVGAITGGATSEVITHNLGTRDVQVALRNNADPWDEVLVDNEATSTNTVTIRSVANLPAGYRIIIHA